MTCYSAAKAYYDMNGTNIFSFKRAFEKNADERSIAPVSNDYVNVWIEKTILVCAEAFPTVRLPPLPCFSVSAFA